MAEQALRRRRERRGERRSGVTGSVTAGKLVTSIVDRLNAAYIFPDRAAQAAAQLSASLKDGRYEGHSGPDLCELISDDLRRATDDKHLRLIWHDSAAATQDEDALIAQLREQIRQENYGVRQVEVLPGNVGLIALTIIPEASTGGEVIAAAMRLVAGTDALILDLRSTRGGAPDGVALLASYFFEDGETRLSDVIEGPAGPTRQFWTAAYLPGPRFLSRPLFVLTSSSTFSGGEALAYDLQVLGRVTVVGETTRGGAHPSAVIPIAEQVELRLPIARSVNPMTGTNWEGVGVDPDVPVRAEDALVVAVDQARAQVHAARIDSEPSGQ